MAKRLIRNDYLSGTIDATGLPRSDPDGCRHPTRAQLPAGITTTEAAGIVRATFGHRFALDGAIPTVAPAQAEAA